MKNLAIGEIDEVTGGWCLCQNCLGGSGDFTPATCSSEAECKSTCCGWKHSEHWGWTDHPLSHVEFKKIRHRC